jgi:hypothetical protein
MKTIWKFEIPLGASIHWGFEIKMPKLSTPLSVGVQHGAPVLWVLVEPSDSVEHRFLLVGTGKEMPEYSYSRHGWHKTGLDLGNFIGTYQVQRQMGRFVGHVFYLGLKA